MSELIKKAEPSEAAVAAQIEQQKITPGKIIGHAKVVLPFFKKPKIVSLIILLLTLVVISLALTLMDNKKKEEKPPEIPLEITSPTPSPSTDPSLETINKRVTLYNQKLDELEDYRKKLNYPIVDLDISFE